MERKYYHYWEQTAHVKLYYEMKERAERYVAGLAKMFSL
jgi:hypothetical protein